jgi:hypothetical protein
VRLIEGGRDDHAFAGGETIGLDDDRRAARIDMACAASASVNVAYSAVGIPCRTMNALAKSLELSSWAAACVGPKILSPAARNASTTPAASGASGPTTVSAIRCSCANATKSALVVKLTLTRPGSSAGAGIARRDKNLGDPRRLRQFPRQRMLASAAPNDEKVHRARAAAGGPGSGFTEAPRQ